MSQPRTLDKQIMRGLEEVDASPHFSGEHLWLTFYLCGPEQSLIRVAATLVERGWINSDGWSSGFIYPKKCVRRAASEILQLAREVEKLCDTHGAKIDLVDADTTPDERSQFVTLFTPQEWKVGFPPISATRPNDGRPEAAVDLGAERRI